MTSLHDPMQGLKIRLKLEELSARLSNIGSLFEKYKNADEIMALNISCWKIKTAQAQAEAINLGQKGRLRSGLAKAQRTAAVQTLIKTIDRIENYLQDVEVHNPLNASVTDLRTKVENLYTRLKLIRRRLRNQRRNNREDRRVRVLMNSTWEFKDTIKKIKQAIKLVRDHERAGLAVEKRKVVIRDILESFNLVEDYFLGYES